MKTIKLEIEDSAFDKVIPYRINTDKNRIEVLGIFGENEWAML